MTEFTPFQSLAGGALIGLAAVLLMALHGRIAGMTGILGGLIDAKGDRSCRLVFLIGAIAAPLLLTRAIGLEIAFDSAIPWPWLVIGGFMVGIGVSFGGGCTSGHGICGLARLSPRSLVAVPVFMLAAGVTVFVIRHVIGGL